MKHLTKGQLIAYFNKPVRITRSDLLDKAAAECVEELLQATQGEGREPWFVIIRRKLSAVAALYTPPIHRKP